MADEKKLKILASSYDFLPQVGGIAMCAKEILTALSKRSDVEITALLRNDAPKTNFKSVPISFVRTSWFAFIFYIFHFNRMINKTKPDVILNFLWWPEAAALFFLSVFKKKMPPYFVYVHGMEIFEGSMGIKSFLRKLLIPVKLRTLKNAACVFAVSNFTKQLLEKQAQGINIKVIYHGVDAKTFQVSKKPEYLVNKYDLSGKIVFFTVSRLHSFKGIDQAILAFSEVYKKNRNIAYLIAGKGPFEDTIKKLIEDLNLKGVVFLVGSVSESELVHFHQASDCFVLMSQVRLNQPNFEGFGISILEAAACGKPSLVSSISGTIEAIEYGKSGWSADPLNTSDIEEKMNFIVSHDEELVAKGRVARSRCEEYFHWDRCADDVVQNILKVKSKCVE